MPLVTFELLSFASGLRWEISLKLCFAQLSLSIVRYGSFRRRHWNLDSANDVNEVDDREQPDGKVGR